MVGVSGRLVGKCFSPPPLQVFNDLYSCSRVLSYRQPNTIYRLTLSAPPLPLNSKLTALYKVLKHVYKLFYEIKD